MKAEDFLALAKSGPKTLVSTHTVEQLSALPRKVVTEEFVFPREAPSEIIFRGDSSNDADARFPCRWTAQKLNLVTLLSGSINLGHQEEVGNEHLLGFNIMTDASGNPMRKVNPSTKQEDDVYLAKNEAGEQVEAFLVPDVTGLDCIVDVDGNQYPPEVLMEFRFYFGRPADKSASKTPKGIALLGITGNRGVPMKPIEKFDANGNKIDQERAGKSTNIDWTAIPGLQGVIEGTIIKTAGFGSDEEKAFLDKFKSRLKIQDAYLPKDTEVQKGIQRPVAAQVPAQAKPGNDAFKGDPED